MIDVIIVAGYLGAGKTTFIRKLLKEAFPKNRVVLIQNDFGDIGIGGLSAVDVTALRSGCICCDLSGDFVKSDGASVQRYHPDKIIIEPAGTAKLSDVMKACSDKRLKLSVSIAASITVADVKRCKMYHENFGEFFEDQLKNADIVLFSRIDTYPDKTEGARELVHTINPRAAIYTKPWQEIDAADLLHSVQLLHSH
jgi:G3E family GTPase